GIPRRVHRRAVPGVRARGEGRGGPSVLGPGRHTAGRHTGPAADPDAGDGARRALRLAAAELLTSRVHDDLGMDVGTAELLEGSGQTGQAHLAGDDGAGVDTALGDVVQRGPVLVREGAEAAPDVELLAD